MTKNPVHDAWDASWITDQRYRLDQLAEHLAEAGTVPPASWRRIRRAHPVGLGRNCTLFETARHADQRPVSRLAAQ